MDAQGWAGLAGMYVFFMPKSVLAGGADVLQ